MGLIDLAMDTRTLPNGLEVVAIERPASTVALLSVDVRVGARYEGPRDAGLSHFLEHMVFQGCDRLPRPEQVNEAAERMGAAFDAHTSRDHTHYEHRVAPERLDDSAALLAALLRAPAFNDIESERAIILEESLDEVDEKGEIIDAETLSRLDLWPRSPMGRSVIGKRAHLERFGRSDLRRHHQTYYGARNMVVTVVGPEPVAALHTLVERHFGALAPGEPRTAAPAGPLPDGPVVRFVDDSRSQCDVRLVHRSCGEADPDNEALILLRLALDDGLASRLHRRLGSELGLAYEMWASWERYLDTGAFELGAHVSPGKALRFVEEGLALLGGLVERPPEGEELERLRFRARWMVRCALDSAEGLAAVYGTPHLYEDPPTPPEDRLARIDALDAAALAGAARRLLEPRGRVVCVVGPLAKSDRRAIRRAVRRFAV